VAELGQALGYWAARWQPVPAATPSGAARPEDVLASGATQEMFARAVEHGDEHVIKLADACLEVYERTGDDVLGAAVRATELIAPVA